MKLGTIWHRISPRVLGQRWLGRSGKRVRQRFLRQYSQRRLIRMESLEERMLLATFTWDGGGATTNWSDADNWDQVPAATPGPSDDVVFNATSAKASVLDAAFTASIRGLSINAGYTNTVSLANTLTVTTNGVNWGAGTTGILSAGSQTINVNGGNWSRAAGSFVSGTS